MEAGGPCVRLQPYRPPTRPGRMPKKSPPRYLRCSLTMPAMNRISAHAPDYPRFACNTAIRFGDYDIGTGAVRRAPVALSIRDTTYIDALSSIFRQHYVSVMFARFRTSRYLIAPLEERSRKRSRKRPPGESRRAGGRPNFLV